MSEQQDRLSNRDVITLKHDITLSDSDEEELTSVPFDPEVKTLSSSDDEDECGGDDGGGGGAAGRLMSSASGQSATFSLKGGSTSFSSRSRSIFDSLDTAAKVASSALGQDNVIDGVFARPPPPPPLASNGKRPRGGGESKTDRPPLRDSSGPVSSFRTGGGEPHGRDSSGPVSSFRTGGGEPHGRGSGRPRRGGGVPDYLLHPERWTCYSLEDVPDSSDADNRATAHQYLSSLQRRKERMEEEEEEEEDEAFVPAYNQGSDQSDCRSSQHKILFSRPGRGRQKVSAGREKEKALCHLDEDEGKEGGTEKAGERARNVGDEEEEEEEGRPTIRPPAAQDRQRKRKQQAGSEEMEEDEEEHEKNPGGFVAFRKSSNRKNYRRTSEQDD